MNKPPSAFQKLINFVMSIAPWIFLLIAANDMHNHRGTLALFGLLVAVFIKLDNIHETLKKV